ncbi:MAG: hypothetical protein QOC81_1968 [Thermoanaerobaculia bacterium]|jgi:hypothetical protein|nr:hypothetical protein [Thermoanaerobaculia bacterium]
MLQMFRPPILSWLLVAFALTALAEPPAVTQAEMNKAAGGLERRFAEIAKLKETAPGDYVNAMQSWIDDLARNEDKYRSSSQNYRMRYSAVMEWMKLADFARTKLHAPARAISIYQRAEGHVAKGRPVFGMHDLIADIYEFDLNDRAAAAATFRQLRDAYAGMPKQRRADYAAWDGWKKKWLDAEIAFLENGRRFEGALTAADLTGFQQQIYFGAGMVITNGEPDASFNPYEAPDTLPAATHDKLLRIPGSHTTFLRVWLYAVRLRSTADARAWIERNDRAGFWADSLLTLAAVTDRLSKEEQGNPRRDVGAMIVRLPSGDVTGMALLGREYAKSHALPALPKNPHH